MRNRSFATLGLLALLATTSALGQKIVRVDIPFEFHVGKSVMPAGHYVVRRDFSNTEGVLLLKCRECRAKAVAETSQVSGYHRGVQAEACLVFHKYGNTYFLSEVWSPGIETGRSLMRSKDESELIRTASLARTDEIVLARR